MDPVEQPGSASAVDDRRVWSSARLALLAFCVFLAGSFLLLFELGDYQWFHYDEWDFLAGRDGGDIGDLFRPHNEHWSTLPILAYRAIFAVVGLRAYWPYQVAIFAVHLIAAGLLRVVMRRAGVSPWVATIAAAILVLFGPGEQNIVWAFQLGFVGAFALGLAQLILADHDGPVDRRDWFGLAAGVAALMCAGVGVSMAMVVGMATLLRRGWRTAAFHTVPLAVLYGIYSLIQDPTTFVNPLGQSRSDIAKTVAEFPVRGISRTFAAIGYFPGVGIALGVILVVGLAVAWLPLDFAQFRRRAATPAALAIGAVAFMLISGVGRWFFTARFAYSSRYLYLIAGFLLPGLAVAADALLRRWRVLTVPVLALLLVGIPFNAANFGGEFPFTDYYFRWQETRLMALPYAPFASSVSPSIRPDTMVARDLTIGWLVEQKDAGRLPPRPTITPALANELKLILGVAQILDSKAAGKCRQVGRTIDITPEKGESFGIRFGFAGGRFTMALLENGEPASGFVGYDARYGGRFVTELDGLSVRVKGGDPANPMTYCE